MALLQEAQRRIFSICGMLTGSDSDGRETLFSEMALLPVSVIFDWSIDTLPSDVPQLWQKTDQAKLAAAHRAQEINS
jgi:hypothetical protein